MVTQGAKLLWVAHHPPVLQSPLRHPQPAGGIREDEENQGELLNITSPPIPFAREFPADLRGREAGLARTAQMGMKSWHIFVFAECG